MKLNFCIVAAYIYMPTIINCMEFALSKPIKKETNTTLETFKINASRKKDTLGSIEYLINNDKKTGWLDKVFVQCSYRKNGIGSALLLAACKHMQQRGCTMVSGIPCTPRRELLHEPTGKAFMCFALLSGLKIVQMVLPRPMRSHNNETTVLIGGIGMAHFFGWKFMRSHTDFFKKRGAQENVGSSILSFDLNRNLDTYVRKKKVASKL